ncbi:unnamed protein product [Sphagnum tenellum]
MRLDEFSPSRSQFAKTLNDSSLSMGFECEVILPESSTDDDDAETDYAAESERINNMDWSEVEGHAGRRAKERVNEAFHEWLSDKVQEEWQEVSEKFTRQYCIDNDLIDPEEPSDDDDEVIADNTSDAHDVWIEEEEQGIYDQYSMDDFIESEYRNMQSFVSYFDIDIEPDYDSYRSSSSSVKDVHQDAAYSLGRKLGKTVLVHHGGANDWHVEQDSSLNDDDNGTGMEIVSPVFSPLSAGLLELKTVFEWIKSNASTNHTTGLHVSFSIAGKTEDDYDYLKMIMLYDENYTAHLFDRLENTYAKQMRDRVFHGLNKKTNVDALTDRDIHSMIATLRKIGQSVHSITEKYFSFRHRSNGVFEFRTMGNADYEDRYEIIRKRIVAMATVMKVGADPNLMAREYLRRVYKMLTSEKFSTPELVVGDPRLANVIDQMSARMPAFAKLFDQNKELAALAWRVPERFLRVISRMPRLDVRQIRQLRLYVGKMGLKPKAMANLRDEYPKNYNVLASYLRWPMVVQGDQRQATLPFVQAGGDELPDAPDVEPHSYGNYSYGQPEMRDLRSR